MERHAIAPNAMVIQRSDQGMRLNVECNQWAAWDFFSLFCPHNLSLTNAPPGTTCSPCLPTIVPSISQHKASQPHLWSVGRASNMTGPEE